MSERQTHDQKDKIYEMAANVKLINGKTKIITDHEFLIQPFPVLYFHSLESIRLSVFMVWVVSDLVFYSYNPIFIKVILK